MPSHQHQRYAALVDYIGTNYQGWQNQKHSTATVQYQVQQALSNIADHPVKVTCSGRTDTGVHASAQIIHFDSNANRSLDNWNLGANRYLPNDIAIRDTILVDNNFHARFDAIRRHYEYYIYNSIHPSALYANRTTYIAHPLDIQAMREAANQLIGNLDFSSFQASGCQAKSPIRHMTHISIKQKDPIIKFCFSANAFLHHMIRNIMGCLIDIGKKRHSTDWINAVLHTKNRSKATVTASANGLFLSQIDYQEHYPQLASLMQKKLPILGINFE